MFWKESVCEGYRFQSGSVVFPVIVSVGMMVVFLAGAGFDKGGNSYAEEREVSLASLNH